MIDKIQKPRGFVILRMRNMRTEYSKEELKNITNYVT